MDIRNLHGSHSCHPGRAAPALPLFKVEPPNQSRGFSSCPGSPSAQQPEGPLTVKADHLHCRGPLPVPRGHTVSHATRHAHSLSSCPSSRALTTVPPLNVNSCLRLHTCCSLSLELSSAKASALVPSLRSRPHPQGEVPAAPSKIDTPPQPSPTCLPLPFI